jgi:hypothetical protein
MTRILETMGERMLSRVLRISEAGACVPEYGSQCACKTDVGGPSYCDQAKKRKVYYKKRWNYNCQGSCSTKSSTNCGTWVSSERC